MVLHKQAAPSAVPRVAPERCRGCGRCAAREVCPPKAVVIVDRGGPAWIDAGRCFGCRACVLACAFGAITAGQ
jgi:MinD superfamily P-loop ATPase